MDYSKASAVFVVLALTASTAYAAGLGNLQNPGDGSVQTGQGNGRGAVDGGLNGLGREGAPGLQNSSGRENAPGLAGNRTGNESPGWETAPGLSGNQTGRGLGIGTGEGQGVGPGLNAANLTHLKQMIRERKQVMEQELENMSEDDRKVYRNQNRVREAVHAMLAVDNLTGGIGRNISEIARKFNNSVQKTIHAEKKIEKRGGLTRFFFGGDDEAADDIEEEVEQNQERLLELNQLKDSCDCSEGVKEALQEQMQNLQQEQNRLRQLAQEEKNSKGLLGWLWK